MMAGGRRLCTLNRVTQAIRERYFSVDKLSDRSFFFFSTSYIRRLLLTLEQLWLWGKERAGELNCSFEALSVTRINSRRVAALPVKAVCYVLSVSET